MILHRVSLSYNAQNVFIKNTSVVNLIPTISGGDSLNYTIIPALPEGLSLNTTTGVISGMPTIISSPTTYVVTASNSVGATSFEMVITVNDIAPSSLSYNNVQQVFFKNDPIVNLIPTISGGAVSSYSISPALPTGLSINVATGVISGTPTVAAAMTTYTVTATNASGSSSFGVVITVNNQPSRVKKIEFWNTSQTYNTKTIYYFYQNNLISEISERENQGQQLGTRKSFYYNSGQLNKMITTFSNTNGPTDLPRTNKFYYSQGLITKDTLDYSPHSNHFVHIYDNGKIMQTYVGDIGNPAANLYVEYEYHSDGNLYKKTSSYAPNNKVFNTYDSKNNPLRLGGFTSEYLALEAVPFNNPTSMNNETYVYEYNAFDYPIKKTTYINGLIESVAIYTYE
jgi:hypothetical protein